MDAGFRVIAKLEAAERQLDQAIRLFFDRGDEVAVHTLASAAYQILSDLCAQRGIPREIEDSAILEEIGAKGQVIAAMRKPQNFFKHADRDADETVRLSPMLSVCFMLYGVNFRYALTKCQSVEGNVLRMWLCLKHPERVPEPYRSAFANASVVLDHSELEFFAQQIRRSKAQ
jgi:hypothetical protein